MEGEANPVCYVRGRFCRRAHHRAHHSHRVWPSRFPCAQQEINELIPEGFEHVLDESERISAVETLLSRDAFFLTYPGTELLATRKPPLSSDRGFLPAAPAIIELQCRPGNGGRPIRQGRSPGRPSSRRSAGEGVRLVAPQRCSVHRRFRVSSIHSASSQSYCWVTLNPFFCKRSTTLSFPTRWPAPTTTKTFSFSLSIPSIFLSHW
jgi:hypothetical protein